MTPTLVLTRPEAQSRDIAARLGAGLRVIISPVMRIAASGECPNVSPFAGVVLTSANAVPFSPDLRGKPVWCVGEKTADAARAAGAVVRLVARDADDLVAQVQAEGPILHLRGEHARGRIAERLTSAGIETEEAVVYRQEALPLSDEALAVIAGDGPVVLPVYSPRSAKLVGRQIGRLGARVAVIAISAAAAEAWLAETGVPAQVVPEPNGRAMLSAIRAALRR